ncbi:PREDICTED: semaphorin-1A-like [Polistes canadensis]|uniref:semaphorin-1A-like n=1 Tax=Polistes canadensis TaxID=91411 RepID=UPI000718D01A|nr:PREDICTED: semaphorin-1A-like [Polistes canadensis]
MDDVFKTSNQKLNFWENKICNDCCVCFWISFSFPQCSPKIEILYFLITGEVIGQRFLGNESHVEHFKLLERVSTSILIGARNAIYNISLHDLTEIIDQRFQWSSSYAHKELCNLKGRSDDECQNYLRVFGRQSPNKFLVCGTNAYKPLCRQFTIKVSLFTCLFYLNICDISCFKIQIYRSNF